MAGRYSTASGNHRWRYPMRCALSVEISIKEKRHVRCSEASEEKTMAAQGRAGAAQQASTCDSVD